MYAFLHPSGGLMTTLDAIYADRGSQQMDALLREPDVSQICVNRHDLIFYWDSRGPKKITETIFSSPQQYISWLDSLLTKTDAGTRSVANANTSVIEASFIPDATDLYGSIHISTREITRDQPALTIRKQPRENVTLDQMLNDRMMNEEMRMFLEMAMHGRLNILISGGSGAGKTTLARAFGHFIDPANRVITVEEIDELHLADQRENVVALTTYRSRDELGRVVREVTLDDLVREALRMRGDRIWVGETRGKEAYALVKACNSGHDGSITTVHADTGPQAVEQLSTYVMEAGLDTLVAQKQVSRAFNLVVQVSKEKMGRRVIREITELEAALETGGQQRSVPLYTYDPDTEGFSTQGQPTRRLRQALERYGVNYSDLRYH
jgi:pilus assembly protein CpaF